MATVASATDRTLGITELLEMILERLPLRDLLLVQRVSKTWRANIEASQKLQEKLFLKGTSTTAAPLTFCVDESIYLPNLSSLDHMQDYKTNIYDAPSSVQRA